MNDKKLAELIRRELEVFSVQDLEKEFNRIEGYSENDTQYKQWLERIEQVAPVIKLLVKHSIWLMYEDLGKKTFDARIMDVIRGSINGLSVLDEYVDDCLIQLRERRRGDETPDQPHNPLPE